MRRIVICALSVGLAVATAVAQTKAHTLMNGRLHYVTPSSWVEGDGQKNDTSDSAQFEVPNPATEGTSESANVMVSASWSLPERDIAKFSDRALKTLPPGTHTDGDAKAPTGERLVMSRSERGGTTYIVIDTFGFAGGAHVWCRFAYPILKGTPPGWNEATHKAYNALIASVSVDGKPVYPRPKAAK